MRDATTTTDSEPPAPAGPPPGPGDGGAGAATPPPRRPRRRIRAPFGDPPRRAHPAGQAIVVLMIALALAAFLNARSLRREAQIAEPGIARDLKLALSGAVLEVSTSVGADLPRRGLQAAIGRSGVDDVNTQVDLSADITPVDDGSIRAGASAGAPSPAEPAASVQVEKPVFTPERPMRIWTAGDSVAIVPGQALVRIASGNPVLQSASPPDGRLASGLERPDVFNWFEHIPAEIERLKPNLVVLSFGANDDHGYITGAPGGSINGFATVEWSREYRRRVGGLMSKIAASGRLQVWLLPPITRDSAQSERYKLIGRLIEQEAELRPARVRVVDMAELLSGPGGAYVDYVESSGGAYVRVRASDGVHLDPAGGDIVAREVIAKAREMADLRRTPRDGSGEAGGSRGSAGSGASGGSGGAGG